MPTIVPAAHRHYRAGAGGIAEPAAAFEEVPGIGPSLDLSALVSALALPRDTQLVVENNINCSAVAEARRPERGGADLVYLHLGQGGVGIGIFSDGRLLRGTTGSAGEMRWFPFLFGPDAPRPAFTLEEYFGARGFLGRVRSRYADGDAPATVADVFARAEAGDRISADAIDHYAGQVALALVAFISVTDPAVAVLGGGRQQRAPARPCRLPPRPARTAAAAGGRPRRDEQRPGSRHARARHLPPDSRGGPALNGGALSPSRRSACDNVLL
ncbi:ROK family protein [Microbacterium sp. MMO-153]|uniref:ROK family protein n=1 Tax=unclassified Microbacterium TaxID=2609290 RepID=UPI003FA5A8B7